MILVRLVETPLQIETFAHVLEDLETGAQGWFAGVTRRKTTTESGAVRITKTLHYEAHAPMARRHLERLAEEAAAKHTLSHVVIVHRLGEVPLGEASVLVGCSSPHRANVFTALPWIMDRLKADVPIWKRETYQDESTEWLHP
jgi:molybdopterin synthase catalytic subunit